jgi:hypothetical protein
MLIEPDEANVFVFGSNRSVDGRVTSFPSFRDMPPVTSTVPSVSSVAVGRFRVTVIFPTGCHDAAAANRGAVIASKMTQADRALAVA